MKRRLHQSKQDRKKSPKVNLKRFSQVIPIKPVKDEDLELLPLGIREACLSDAKAALEDTILYKPELKFYITRVYVKLVTGSAPGFLKWDFRKDCQTTAISANGTVSLRGDDFALTLDDILKRDVLGKVGVVCGESSFLEFGCHMAYEVLGN